MGGVGACACASRRSRTGRAAAPSAQFELPSQTCFPATQVPSRQSHPCIPFVAVHWRHGDWVDYQLLQKQQSLLHRHLQNHFHQRLSLKPTQKMCYSASLLLQLPPWKELLLLQLSEQRA